jgi:hypothetical protein
VVTSTTANAEPLEPYEVPTEVYMDRSGLPELVLGSTVSGFVVGPLLTFSLFDDPVRKGSGLFLGPVLGIALPFLLNKDKPVHVAQASTYNFFQRSGLGNGVMLSAMLLDEDTGSAKSLAFIVSGTFIGSTWLGTHLEPKLRLTPGQASALNSSYFIGAGTGAALYSVLVDDMGGRSLALTTFVAANGLSLASYLMRETFDIDRSRVIMMDIGAVGGAFAGVGLGFVAIGTDLEGDSARKALTISALAGAYGGIYLAYVLTKHFDVYKKSADTTVGVVSFESPSPMVLDSVDPKTGARALGLGLNILNGTW